MTDQKGHMKFAFCTTQDMFTDFFTKPLHGALFICMWKKILNLPASTHTNMHRSVLEYWRKMCGLKNYERYKG